MSAGPRDGLIIELLLDGSAEDTSGGNHHGSVHGATPTADRFGRPNRAYRFDGTDDFIAIAPPPRLNERALSVSIWARFETVDFDGWSNGLICQDNGDDADPSRRVFQVSLDCGHLVWHRMIRACDPRARRAVELGRWYHVAAVVDDTAHRLYVDGQLQDTVEHKLWVHPDEPIYIGRKGTPEPYFFLHGALDDVRVFNRALDAADVRALFAEGGYKPPPPVVAAPPLSGTWARDIGDRLSLTFDGERAVTGALPSGRPGNLAAIRTGTFDRETGLLKLEGEARRPDNGAVVPYAIAGRLDGNQLTLDYTFAEMQGRAVLRKVTWSRNLLWRAGKVGAKVARRFERVVKPLLVPIERRWRSSLRPTKAANIRGLHERGESVDALVFRDATVEDIPALAELHVRTWSATYPAVRRPPTFAIRERQWREVFAKPDDNWFVIVIQNAKGELIGFARGIVHGDAGDLNKIYLLGEYQRLGIGRRLVGHVVRRFLAKGTATMTLSADEANPSCAFYYALGAENPRHDDGRVDRGAFVWRDLERLASICPVPDASTAIRSSPSRSS